MTEHTEQLKQAYLQLLSLHKQQIFISAKIHDMLLNDEDMSGIDYSIEFMELLRQMRELIIQGIVRNNLVASNDEARANIPFPKNYTPEETGKTITEYLKEARIREKEWVGGWITQGDLPLVQKDKE